MTLTRRDVQCENERVTTEDIACRALPVRLLMERHALYVFGVCATMALQSRPLTLTVVLLCLLGTAMAHSGGVNVVVIVAASFLQLVINHSVVDAHCVESQSGTEKRWISSTIVWRVVWWGLVAMWLSDVQRVGARLCWYHTHTQKAAKGRDAV